MYGLNDASFEWNVEDVQGVKDVRFAQSQVHPTVFQSRRDDRLEGVHGVHVDDDLMTGSDWFEENVIPVLKKRFVYGNWVTDNVVHCGQKYTRGRDISVIISHEKFVHRFSKIKDGSNR